MVSTHEIRLGINVPAKPPIGDINLAVRIARLTGLDATMIWDHFQDFIPQELWQEQYIWAARDRPHAHAHYEYQVLLGYLASRAGNMRLGVGVTEPLRRHPVLLAQALMTLTHLTKRTPILGLGAGEQENTEPYGISMHKAVSKLEEALQIIRQCFVSTGPFDFDGQFFQMKHAIMDLQVPPGRIPPIWLAAHGPRMLRLTGQYADGWYPTELLMPETYGDMLSTIRRHAKDAGRDPDRIVPSLASSVVLAPTDDEAKALFNMRAARYLGLTLSDDTWKKYGLTHPLGEGFRGIVDIRPEEIEPDQLHDALDQVPDEMLLENVTWGSPERVAGIFRNLGDAGLKHVVITPVSVMASEKILRYLPRGLWSLRRKLM